MIITIIDYGDLSDYEFDYEIDDKYIKKYLIEAIEEDYNSPNFIELPEELPVDPYSIGEPYSIEEYVDEYMLELMGLEWYYDYVYSHIMEDFGEEIWKYYGELLRDPYDLYGVKRGDFH